MIRIFIIFLITAAFITNTNSLNTEKAIAAQNRHFSPIQKREEQQRGQRQQISSSAHTIYGVRWMLGNAFSALPAYKSNEYYVLMFNSKTLLPGSAMINLQNIIASCSSATFNQTIVTATIYKCIITEPLGQFSSKVIPFQIILENAILNGTDDAAKIHLNREVLYTGSFRPIPQQSIFEIFFIGAWQVANQQWMLKIKQQFLWNEKTCLILFTGDFYPSLSLQNYEQILSSIQPITSQATLFMTNGNIESNQLFLSSFYSPQWQQYQSFFSLITFGSFNLSILLFTPSQLMESNNYNINIPLIFIENFDNKLTDELKNNFFVIALSAFSYECSKEPICQENKLNMAYYHAKLNEIGVNLYISSSVNGYQRTKGICSNGTLNSGEKNVYSYDCPIYVNQGAQNQDLSSNIISQAIFSQYSSLSSGFGQIRFQERGYQLLHLFNYSHFDCKTNKIQDNFVLKAVDNTSEGEQFNQTVQHIIMACEYSILLFILIFIAYTIISLKLRGRKRRQDERIEIVQEGNVPPNSIRNQLNG